MGFGWKLTWIEIVFVLLLRVVSSSYIAADGSEKILLRYDLLDQFRPDPAEISNSIASGC